MKIKVITPWHNAEQLKTFLSAWGIEHDDSRIILQQDTSKEGCARTKNRGMIAAMDSGADAAIILDDDCFPGVNMTLQDLIDRHEAALAPQPVTMFDIVTNPPSRGTPYFNRSITMPVAASMGFWTHIGDYDAPGQLVHGATTPMEFHRKAYFGRYFPLCGMNLAFRLEEWPWCQFVDVPRFDDIWQGFLWQKKAYADGKCFNLNGPLVRHSRQSNVWQNLRDESISMERNETIWQEIHALPLDEYGKMLSILGISF